MIKGCIEVIFFKKNLNLEVGQRDLTEITVN